MHLANISLSLSYDHGLHVTLAKTRSNSKKIKVRKYDFEVPQKYRSRLALFFPPVLYSFFFGAIWLGPILTPLRVQLDPSFIYGVEKAAINHVSFGNHFIATYGPLSYAITSFFPQNLIKAMICQILIVLAAGIGVYLFSKLYLGKAAARTRLFFVLLVLLALSLSNTEWIYLNVFLLYLFIYVKVDSRHRYYLSLLLATVASLFTLVKFTIGFGSIATLLVAVGVGIAGQTYVQRIKNILSVLVVYLAVLSLVAYALGTHNIVAYIISSERTSSGFSNALSLITPSTAIATKYVLGALVALFVWILARSRKFLLQYSFLLPALFMVWKYAVVRQDGHIMVILQTIPFIIVLLTFSFKEISRVDVFAVAAIVACCLIAIWANGTNSQDFTNAIGSPINKFRAGQSRLFWDIKGQKQRWALESADNLKPAVLSPQMRQAIGNNGVDIFPWEASIIAANNLKWDNRPSPFSFDTYTPQFDEANAKFFDYSGPKFIIWHSTGIGSGLGGIDGRNVLWDEPLTLRSILNHYKYVSSNSEFILLERLSGVSKKKNNVLMIKSHVGSSWSNVPLSTSLVCARIYIKNSPLQDLKDFVVRERPFYLNIKYKDGTIDNFRFVRETASEGILISPVPMNWANFVDFLQNHHSSDQVKAVSVVGEPTATVSYLSCGQGSN